MFFGDVKYSNDGGNLYNASNTPSAICTGPALWGSRRQELYNEKLQHHTDNSIVGSGNSEDLYKEIYLE